MPSPPMPDTAPIFALNLALPPPHLLQ